MACDHGDSEMQSVGSATQVRHSRPAAREEHWLDGVSAPRRILCRRVEYIRMLVFFGGTACLGIAWWVARTRNTGPSQFAAKNLPNTIFIWIGVLFVTGSSEHALIGKIPLGPQIPMGRHGKFLWSETRWFLRREHPIMFWVSIAFEYLVGLVFILMGLVPLAFG